MKSFLHPIVKFNLLPFGCSFDVPCLERECHAICTLGYAISWIAGTPLCFREFHGISLVIFFFGFISLIFSHKLAKTSLDCLCHEDGFCLLHGSCIFRFDCVFLISELLPSKEPDSLLRPVAGTGR